MNPLEIPKSYQPIFLLCVSYMILKSLIFARIEQIIDPCCLEGKLSFNAKNQLGSSHFIKKKHLGFFLSICRSDGGIWLCMAPWPYMQAAWGFCQISTWLDWSWNLSKQDVSPLNTTGDRKQSIISRLKNGVPQGSVWTLLLSNLFIFTSTPALRNFLKVYLRRQFSIASLFWKVKGLWEA